MSIAKIDMAKVLGQMDEYMGTNYEHLSTAKLLGQQAVIAEEEYRFVTEADAQRTGYVLEAVNVCMAIENAYNEVLRAQVGHTGPEWTELEDMRRACAALKLAQSFLLGSLERIAESVPYMDEDE